MRKILLFCLAFLLIPALCLGQQVDGVSSPAKVGGMAAPAKVDGVTVAAAPACTLFSTGGGAYNGDHGVGYSTTYYYEGQGRFKPASADICVCGVTPYIGAGGGTLDVTMTYRIRIGTMDASDNCDFTISPPAGICDSTIATGDQITPSLDHPFIGLKCKLLYTSAYGYCIVLQRVDGTGTVNWLAEADGAASAGEGFTGGYSMTWDSTGTWVTGYTPGDAIMKVFTTDIGQCN